MVVVVVLMVNLTVVAEDAERLLRNTRPVNVKVRIGDCLRWRRDGDGGRQDGRGMRWRAKTRTGEMGKRTARRL